VAWVHAFVDVPAEHVEVTRAFWSAVTGWSPGEAWPGHPEFTSLTPPTGTPYLHVQTIDGAPRVHLDLLGDLDVDPARLERLCVDVPAERYDAELAFWRSATGWADEPVEDPEFARLVHRAASPVQLLVQRLGDDDGAPRARAHLDLGSDDLAAEVTRVRALGARELWPGNGFVALEDPAGLPFCVTANDPDR
jgi:catechol 2,3-dioxygenase-like lactoylglutathione lyase family enzyme